MGAKLATAVKEALEATLPQSRQSSFSGAANGEVLYVTYGMAERNSPPKIFRRVVGNQRA